MQALYGSRYCIPSTRFIKGRVAGGRSGGRTRCALLTRYAFGDDTCNTIGSRGFIAAVTRTAGPPSFGGAGLCVDQWLGWRDSELTCVCSRTGVSNGPGDSYRAAERHAEVLCETDIERSVAPRQMLASSNDIFLSAV